jgi:hypothetical protein
MCLLVLDRARVGQLLNHLGRHWHTFKDGGAGGEQTPRGLAVRSDWNPKGVFFGSRDEYDKVDAENI